VPIVEVHVSATTAPETPEAPEQPKRRGGIGRAIRWVVAMLTCVLAAVAITGAVAAYYARLELLDTQQFTERVSPVAEDEQVQQAVATMVTEKINDALDVDAIAQQATGWASVEDAPPMIQELIASAVESVRGYVESEVEDFVASPAFQEVWDTAVSEAHASLVSALQGDNSGALTVDGDTLTLDLGQTVEIVKEKLVENDFALAAEIPPIEADYVLLDSEQVPELQRDTERLEWAADWLPWIALALLVVTFVLAPRRWWAALVLGVLSAAMAVGALIAISMGRTLFANRARDAQVAPKTYDAFTEDLQWAYLIMIAAAVLLIVVALLAIMMQRRRRRNADTVDTAEPVEAV
jgi:hypothetical protein